MGKGVVCAGPGALNQNNTGAKKKNATRPMTIIPTIAFVARLMGPIMIR
jgi:hypothetical protein